MSAATDFLGKTVMIVGGTSGIGLACARLFAERGAQVAIAGHDAVEGHIAQTTLLESGIEAFFVKADVTREADMKDLIKQVTARFGRIHVAVNNAGIEGRFAPLHELAIEEFDRIIAVNLRGVWLGMKYQIRHMLEKGGGSIVNTSSSAGVTAIPNVAAYTASKHGIIGLTRSAALEQATVPIRINSVAPGPVRTALLERMVAGQMPLDSIAAQVPMQRISEPEESARAIVWLASEEASFVTGQTLSVDGGLTVP